MGEMRDSIADIWGQRTPNRGDWPVRVGERTSEAADHWVQSACVFCSNGCSRDIGIRLLTQVGWLINRAVGVPVPVWAAPPEEKDKS